MARPSLDKNVKFKKLVRRLRMPKPHVRGYLETMWDVGCECGDPLLGAPDDVEAAAEWEGEPRVFFDALRDGGWIDETDQGWEIHDFFVNAPEYVVGRRAREAERNRRKICRACSSEYHSADRRSLYCSDACKHFAYRQRKSENSEEIETERDRTLQIDTNETVVETDRDGPRRHSQHPTPNTQATKQNFPPPSQPPSGKFSPASRDGETDGATPPVLVFPTNGNGPSEWALTEGRLAEWSAAYPDMDVLAECRKALAWIKVNRPKTHRGTPRFLVNWLNKANNWGASKKPKEESEEQTLPPPDPHDQSIHGMIDVTGKRRWCSREGGWIPEDDWTPLQEGDALD